MAYSSSSSNANSKVEAQLVAHQKNQLWYEEKIRFMKIDLDDKTDVLTYHKKLLAEAVKEKEELKTKLELFETSSKSLKTLLNSQLSANDKDDFGHDGAKESKESNSEDDEIVVKPKEVTKTDKPIFEKIESVNARNETVRQAENPRKKNKTVLIRTDRIPVNIARASSTNNVNTDRHNFNKQTILTNAAKKFNTIKPIVNDVNTAGDKAVSAVGGIGKTVVKPSADCV
ncbi:hypothetical protein Tco_0978186 [Tanacetum coccineum]|uniref:Uncharacterized protein n=1 Tax=Tanacetum coccineum TaxID=301880 RepID=A0ABQ5EMC9_9ASTR